MKPKYIAVLLLMILALGIAGNQGVGAQDPTIPTRTPTPDAAATSDDPGDPPPGATEPADPDPGDPEPTAAATATESGTGSQPPAATNTSTAPGQTPGSAATSDSSQPAGAGTSVPGTCDETPYVRAVETVTVYAGPGNDYEEVAQLGPDEMRPITGRAYYASWWQIQFDAETLGWVADAEVDEYGNTNLALPNEAPSIDGETPTPGALWNPTPLPLPNCVPPTPTPTATPAEASAVGSGGGVSGSEGESASDPLLPTSTVGMVSAEIEESAPVVQEESDTAGTGITPRNSETSRAASPTGAMNLILPLAGLALIGGGIVLALVSRRQSGAKPDEPN